MHKAVNVVSPVSALGGNPMNRHDRVRLSIQFIRLFCILFVPTFLFGIAFCQLRVAFITLLVKAIALTSFVCCLVGILLSVCPRCGKSNKDALYSLGRMLPILEIALFGKLPLCYACERELAAKASARQKRQPRARADGSLSTRTVCENRIVCNVDALTRAQCVSIEIPRKVRAALVLGVIAIPNLVLLTLAILHVTGVVLLW